MRRPVELRLAGTGGQGVILAGVLLAEAAVRDGKNVVQTQSYGPEARGGASRAEVLISDDVIHHPRVIQADFTLCMSQEACDTYGGKMRRNALLIVDADHVTRTPTTRAVRVPLTSLAKEATGQELAANVVGVGVLAGLSGVVSRQSVEEAICVHVPKGTEEMNLKALAVGYKSAERMRTEA